MSPPNIARSSILYQNAARDVTLIDVPTSVAVAQQRSGSILSSAPPEEPRPRDKPRPKKAENNAQDKQTVFDATLHGEFKELILRALAQIKANVSGSWCVPRRIAPKKPRRGEASMDRNDPEKELEWHMREWAAHNDDKEAGPAFDFQRMMASLGAEPEVGVPPPNEHTRQWTASYIIPATSFTSSLSNIRTEPWTSSLHNPHPTPLSFTITQNTSSSSQPAKAYTFTLPPGSSIFQHTGTDSSHFRTAFRALTATHSLPRHFDLVILDPPWSNRSAKRAHAYAAPGGMPYITRMLRRMDIDTYLEHGALVCVWITNKAALRDHVLGPGGLFESWNVGLVEEWVWVKTTTVGEPIFDIDDVSRKPYEVLLVGRAAETSWGEAVRVERVRRRVLAGVPDVHSRKPCLKELLEPLFGGREYSALEVFARYAVEGWTAWGDEVLKFNWDWYWDEGVGEKGEDGENGDGKMEHELPVRSLLI